MKKVSKTIRIMQAAMLFLLFPLLQAEEPSFKRVEYRFGGAGSYSLPCPRPDRPFTGYFRINGGIIKIAMCWTDGSTDELSIVSENTIFNRVIPAPRPKPGQKPKPPTRRKITVRGGAWKMTGFPLERVYAKPNLKLYDNNNLQFGEKNPLPPAEKQILKLQMAYVPSGIAFYINGSYAGSKLKPAAQVCSMTVHLRPGQEFADVSKKITEEKKYRVIDLSMKADTEARLDLSGNLPFRLPEISKGIDLRGIRAVASKVGYTDDYDQMRSAFDGMPESCIFSVPAAQYCKAYLLYSPIPAKKTSPINFVMTRYTSQGRGDAIVKVLVEPSAGVKAGTAEVVLNGQTHTLPVHLAEITVGHSSIQDLIYKDRNAVLPFYDYLDVDIQGEHRPAIKAQNVSPSAVLYAIVLEKTPAQIRYLQGVPGNVFDSEKPEIPVWLKAAVPGSYEVSWEISDIDGKRVEKSSMKTTLDKGKEKTLTVRPAVKEKGWYRIAFTAKGPDGKVFSTRQDSFALLHPDTRKAGFDSPYMTWWFGQVHFNYPDPEIIGPVLKKAGFRYTTAYSGSTEENLAKWGISCAMIPFPRYIYFGPWFAAAIAKDDFAQLDGSLVEYTKEFLRRFPHAKYAMIFHESFSDYPKIPEILLDKELAPYPAPREKKEQERFILATRMGKIYREHFPQLKVVIGNSSYQAAGMIESFSKRGYDWSLVDYIGIETPGQGVPESFQTNNPPGASWLVLETMKKCGISKPLTATYEWVCRRKAACGGDRGMAEHLARDVITAHYYNYPLIPIGIIQNAGNTYYRDANYGAIGLMTRDLAPLPAYVSTAVQTRILDQVKFLRFLRTDNPGLYAAEFSRADGKYVYAVWTPDGKAECTLTFGNNDPVVTEDLYGRRRTLNGRNGSISVVATPAMRYLIAGGKVSAAKAGKIKSDPLPGPAISKFKILPENVILHSEPDTRMENYYFKRDGILTHVPARIAKVSDSEQREAAEVVMDLSAIGGLGFDKGGYCSFSLKQPIPVPENAGGVALHAKGNGTTGSVIFEIEDANGKRFLSNGEPWNGGSLLCDLYPKLKLTGWSYIFMALTKKFALPSSWLSMQWYGFPLRSNAMKRPYKLTGFLLSSFPKATRIEGPVPAEQKIRFNQIVFF